MKQILIIIISCVCIFFCIKNFNKIKGDIKIFAQDTTVEYGDEDAYDQAGIIKANLFSPFDVEDHIEQGLPTVIEFYADYCSGCRGLDNHLRSFVKLRPGVAVRQFKLSNEWKPSEIWANYNLNISSIPHVIIYDHDGKLIAQDDGNKKEGFDFIYKWINDEQRREWKRNR